MESFRAGNKTASKSIIMVLDKFDMFCTHTNQTLLYNLFDSVQSQQVNVKLNGDNYIAFNILFCTLEPAVYYWLNITN